MVLDGIKLKQATVPMLLGELLQRKDDNGNLYLIVKHYKCLTDNNLCFQLHQTL